MKAFVILLGIAACGSSDLGPGGGGGDAGAGDDGGHGGTTQKRGYIYLMTTRATSGGTPINAGSVSAQFRTPWASCTEKQVGRCVVSRCTQVAFVNQSAGTITVEGLGAPITLTPAGDKTYPGHFGQPLFGNGETATVRGSGGEIAAFTATVVTPRLVTITAPAATSMLTVNRAAGLHMAWTGGSGDVLVSLVSEAPVVDIDCRFPASSGSATIGADVLTELPAGPGSLNVSTLADAESADVGVVAFYTGVWPDQSRVSASATFN